MKIAYIGHKRIPTREGGVEIVVEELTKGMLERGHQVDVYNRYKKDFEQKKSFMGARIITIPTINKKSLDAVVYSFLATIRAMFSSYDCIHFHAEGPCSMIWIPYILGIRTVATIHGLDWQRSKWNRFASWYLRFGEKCAAKFADEVIVLSRSAQEYFKKEYNRDTVVIPNGINPPVKKNADIIYRQYGLMGEDYILFLARIVPEKGLEYLLKAYKELNTDKKLVIAGGFDNGEYSQRMLDMIKDMDNVITTGFVSGDLLHELFTNCYLYVLPSDVEGMPISLMEAMSYGKLCVTSDISESCDVTGEFGISFKKGDYEDLRDALDYALHIRRPDKRKISRYILDNYTWDNVCDKTEILYREK